MPTSVLPVSPTKAPAAARYLSCLRPQEILVLQGSPLLGAAFAIRDVGAKHVTALAILVIANMCLVAHIFLINDWSNLTSDLADPHKSARVFTARGVGRGELGVLAIGLLGLSLILFSILNPLTLVLSLAIAVLSALYSLSPFNWKGRPLLNTVAHLVGGAVHFLLGYSIWNPIDASALTIATFFAVSFAAGHLTQEIRDYDGDVLNGIGTNAVMFGPRRTFIASFALFTLAHALLFALALQGIVPRPLAALVFLYPIYVRWSLEALADGLTYTSIHRLQTRYRALYAVIGLCWLYESCRFGVI